MATEVFGGLFYLARASFLPHTQLTGLWLWQTVVLMLLVEVPWQVKQ